MSNIIASLNQYLTNRKMQTVIKIMQELYPDATERAGAYFAIGAQGEEAEAFTRGEVVDSIVIQVDDEGMYVIDTNYKSEMMESS